MQLSKSMTADRTSERRRVPRPEALPARAFERKRAEIAARLAPVCTEFPREVFERLTTRAAEIELKYQAAGNMWGPRARDCETESLEGLAEGQQAQTKPEP